MSAHFGWVVPLAASVIALSVMPAVAREDPVEPVKQGPLSPVLQQYAVGSAPAAEDPVVTRPNGRLVVEVVLSDTSQVSLNRLAAVGARVRVVDPDLGMATLAIDAGQLADLASLAPLVRSVQEVTPPQVNATCPPLGAAISEGVAQLNVPKARSDVHVDGTDMTVGVISDSFNFLMGQAQDVQADELPGSGNPCGHTTDVGNLKDATGTGDDPTTDEGRAMAQIVHDVAPGANILFESGWYGQLEMAQSIRNLAANGADIIVDDLTYFEEPMYQDGPIARAVSDVTADGVVYFSSAGNSNYEQSNADVGNYETMALRPTDCPDAVKINYIVPVTCHDFDTAASPDPTYDIAVKAKGTVDYSLGWNQPMYGVSTDLDVCLLDGVGSVLACDRTNEVVIQRPGAAVSWENPNAYDVNLSVVVVRYSTVGSPRFRLVANQTSLTWVEPRGSAAGDVSGPSIYGHNASAQGVTVAAVPRWDSSIVEEYSSRGPAAYCWAPVNGTSPSPALVPCQTTTVDIAATDGVSNSFFGKNNQFFGTSAAAPHAAAVAALILERQPCWTPAQVIAALRNSGRAVGVAPFNAVGSGLIDAEMAVKSTAGPKCDNLAPAVQVTAGKTWYPTSPAWITVAAQDKRTVSDITCQNGTVEGLSDLGTTYATGIVKFEGQGMRTITCTGTDFEGNTGAAPGSVNSVSVGIDMIGPTLICRPATLSVGLAGAVVADVSDPHSGPASPTAVAAFIPHKVGSFLAKVTGADKLGNATTVTCPYTVKASLTINGKHTVKVKIKTPYVAAGLPAHARVQWRVKHAGKVYISRGDKTNGQGEASTKFAFARKGKYLVKVVSGQSSTSMKVTVKG